MSTLVRTVGISVCTIFGADGIRRLVMGIVSIRREQGAAVRKRRPVSTGRRRRRLTNGTMCRRPRETARRPRPYEKAPPAGDRRGRCLYEHGLFSAERIVHPIYFVQLLTG